METSTKSEYLCWRLVVALNLWFDLKSFRRLPRPNELEVYNEMGYYSRVHSRRITVSKFDLHVAETLDFRDRKSASSKFYWNAPVSLFSKIFLLTWKLASGRLRKNLTHCEREGLEERGALATRSSGPQRFRYSGFQSDSYTGGLIEWFWINCVNVH